MGRNIPSLARRAHWVPPSSLWLLILTTLLVAPMSAAPNTKVLIQFPSASNPPAPPPAFTRLDPRDSPTIARLKQNFATAGNSPPNVNGPLIGTRGGDPVSPQAVNNNNKPPNQQQNQNPSPIQNPVGGQPALHQAVMTTMPGDSEDQNRVAQAIQLLVQRQGADVNAVDGRGRTALHVAAELGHAQAAEALLQNGADLGIGDEGGMTPLAAASSHCQAEVASKLIEMAGDGVADYILRQDNEKWTALHDAARGECTALVRMLLKAIPDDRSDGIFSQSKKGWTPLSLAARRGSSSIVKLLSSRANDPEQLFLIKPDGLNALHLAVWNGHTRTVEFILARTSELLQIKDDGGSLAPYITRRDSKGWNALHFAVRYDRPDVLTLLIEQLNEDERPSSLHAVDDEGWSPLHMAARYGKLECLALLLRHAPGNVDAKKDFGWTPLLLAVFAGHTNATTFLVYHGADPALKNDEGVDSFLQARHTCPDCERILGLAEAMRLPMMKNVHGHASNLTRNEPVSSSISVGTRQQDNSAADNKLSTAETPLLQLKMALLKRNIPEALAILNASNNLVLQEADGEDGYPVLHIAVHVENSLAPDADGSSPDPNTTGLTQLILSRGAQVDRVDKERKETALHLAARERKYGAVKALIDAGSDIHARDFVGGTPLLWAASTCPGAFVGPHLGSRTYDQVIWPPFSRQRPLVDITALDQWSQLVGRNFDTVIKTTLDLLLEAAGDQATDYILNEVDDDNASALHLAAVSSCVLGMERLLEHVPEERNAEIFRQLNASRLTPLSIAAGKGPSTLVKILAARAPSIDYLYKQDQFGNTALHRAVTNGQARAVEFLLDQTRKLANAPEEIFDYIGLQNRVGASAFHVAAVGDPGNNGSNGAETLKILIDQLDSGHRDTILHARAKNGMSPLHYAAYRGNVGQVMLLLTAAPGNLDVQALRGFTPLMFATASGHSNVTALLVWNGADITVRDDEGKNAVDHAKESCPGCLPLLEIQKNLANVNQRLCQAPPPLTIERQPFPALPPAIVPRPQLATTSPRPAFVTTSRKPFVDPSEDAGKPPPPQVPTFLRPGGIAGSRPTFEEEEPEDEEEEGGDFDLPPPSPQRRPIVPPPRLPPPPRTTRPPPPVRTTRPPSQGAQIPPFGSIAGSRFPPGPPPATTFRPSPSLFGGAEEEEEEPSPLFPPSGGNNNRAPPGRLPQGDIDGGDFPSSLFGPQRPSISRPRPQTPSPFDADILGQPPRPRPGPQTNVIDDTTGGLFPSVPNFEEMFGISGPQPNIPTVEQQTNIVRPDEEEDFEDGKLGGIGAIPGDLGDDVLGGDFPELIGQQGAKEGPPLGGGILQDTLPGFGGPTSDVNRGVGGQRRPPSPVPTGTLDNILPQDVDNEETGGDFPEPPPAAAGSLAAVSTGEVAKPFDVKVSAPFDNGVLPDKIDSSKGKPSSVDRSQQVKAPRPVEGDDFSGGIGELPGTPFQPPSRLFPPSTSPLNDTLPERPQQPQHQEPGRLFGGNDIDGGIGIGGALRPAVVIKPTVVNVNGNPPSTPENLTQQPGIIIVPQLPGEKLPAVAPQEGPSQTAQNGQEASAKLTEDDITGGDFPSLESRKDFDNEPPVDLLAVPAIASTNVTGQLAAAKQQASVLQAQLQQVGAALRSSAVTSPAASIPPTSVTSTNTSDDGQTPSSQSIAVSGLVPAGQLAAAKRPAQVEKVNRPFVFPGRTTRG